MSTRLSPNDLESLLATAREATAAVQRQLDQVRAENATMANIIVSQETQIEHLQESAVELTAIFSNKSAANSNEILDAIQGLSSMQPPLNALRSELDSAQDAEKDALQRAAAAEASASQLEKELARARVVPPIPIQIPPSKSEKTIRSVVRERDGNGRAMVVDTTVIAKQ